MSRRNYQTKRIHILSWVLLGIAVLGMLTGGVVAYLSYSTPVIENTFKADTDYNPSIAEDVTDNVKTNVKVSVADPNPSDPEQAYAVYVRAAIVVTWRRGDTEPTGQEILLAKAPVEDTDYSLTCNSDDWFEQGGYYYHKAAVEPGSDTAVLISECKPLSTKEGYVLNVEIMTQTIQALGTTDGDNPIPAVQDAWGVYISNGELSPTAPASSGDATEETT